MASKRQEAASPTDFDHEQPESTSTLLHEHREFSSSGTPLIFISHDSRDSELAEAFSKLLGGVSAGLLKSFRSSDQKGTQGFEYGIDWFPELLRKIQSATDVVCLLTKRSLGRPWILYEAGVARGKLGEIVHGLALGIPLRQASTGPFAQFQNCADDIDSLTKLIMQLLRRLPDADPDQEVVQAQILRFKERADDVLATHGGDDEEDDTEDASSSRLFEEVKLMFQDLPSRIDSTLVESGARTRRSRLFHPEILHEAVMMMTHGERSPGLGLMILASPFRDELPWMFEIAAECYRAELRGDVETVSRMHHQFMRAVEFASIGPIARSLRGGRELHMLTREVMHLAAGLAPPEPEQDSG